MQPKKKKKKPQSLISNKFWPLMEEIIIMLCHILPRNFANADSSFDQPWENRDLDNLLVKAIELLSSNQIDPSLLPAFLNMY